MYAMQEMEAVDLKIANLVQAELDRQNSHIELIASENRVSKAVMAAMGSALTNKYTEGYPGNRFYGGCEYVDEMEILAIERAKELFHCTYANVQPHSGSQANLAVYFALLRPGDTILSMDPAHGGNLSHGNPANLFGTFFKVYSYGTDDDGILDYEQVEQLALKYRPKLIVAGASAYSRIIDFKRFREIADEVDAYLMADIANIAGLVAGGVHPSPIPYAHVTSSTTHKTMRGPRGGLILSSKEFAQEHQLDRAVFPGIQEGPLMHEIAAKAICFQEALQPEYKEYVKNVIRNAAALCDGLKKRGLQIVSGGTENHLMLVDLAEKGITGKEMEKLLSEVNITCNKNGIPDDSQSPFVTSGIRLGTPSVTARGMDEKDMDRIAEAITMMIESSENKEKVRKIVKELTEKYPLEG